MSDPASCIQILGASLRGYESPCDVRLEEGLIKSIVEHGSDSDRQHTNADEARAVQALDARTLELLPGFTDLYGRLREPGPSRKGTIASESRAALTAGFTTVLCSPDTTPAIDSVATVELLRQRASGKEGARVIPMAALTVGLDGIQLGELATLQAVGCEAAGQADRPLASSSVLYSAMEYAASFELPLVMTPRDAVLAIDGCAHAGATATRLGLPGIPVAAETLGLASLLELCRETRCRLHLSRLSSARAVEMVDDARQAGLPVTADVGIHHLYFTDELLSGFDTSYHSAVPFRSAADRAALRSGLEAGVIDAICSDHAPHDADARLAPFPVSEPGLSCYDSFLRLLWSLPDVCSLSLEAVIDKVVSGPARLLRSVEDCPASTLRPGMPADLILISTASVSDSDDRAWLSAGENHPFFGLPAQSLCTPLEGIPLRQASVRHAIVQGHVALTAE